MEQIKLENPNLSRHFLKRSPSAVRMTQIAFAGRKDGVKAINLAIGNVSLPVHPAIKERLKRLTAPESPFKDGVIKYSQSAGLEETRKAFLHIIASCGLETKGLYAQITDGSSQAMELMIVGVCGPAGSEEKPLLIIEPFYTNYMDFARRLGRRVVTVSRRLQADGQFSLADLGDIEEVIRKQEPGGLLVIPNDNPTGQMMRRETLLSLARLCVRYNLWMISDEAYRMLCYLPEKEVVSIWGLNNREIPGIEGRRISIETASKVWNACGLRVGALVTDNLEFHEKGVAEYTANLCGNIIGQYLFAALADVSVRELQDWYNKQREYYGRMCLSFTEAMKKALPGIIVSRPDAAIYSVLDVRQLVKPGFDAANFVMFCARTGKAKIDGQDLTLLATPLAGFYAVDEGEENPGKTQMRIAYVETREAMEKVPGLFKELLLAYEKKRA